MKGIYKIIGKNEKFKLGKNKIEICGLPIFWLFNFYQDVSLL